MSKSPTNTVYHISEEEVREFVKEQKAELTEKELQAVAGGSDRNGIEVSALGAGGVAAIPAGIDISRET